MGESFGDDSSAEIKPIAEWRESLRIGGACEGDFEEEYAEERERREREN